MEWVRAYLLLDVVQERSGDVAQSLRGRAGVVMADVVEGLPDVVAVVEATGRLELAELVTKAFESVESLVEHMSLLPACPEEADIPFSGFMGRGCKQ